MPCCFTIHTEIVICTDKVSRVVFTTVIAVVSVCAVSGNMTKLLTLETANRRFNVFHAIVFCPNILITSLSSLSQRVSLQLSKQ